MPMPEQMEQHRQHHQGSAHRQNPSHQGSYMIERRHQLVGQPRTKDAWMPIPGKPPKIGPQHRIEHTHTAVIPASRPAVSSRSVKLLLIRSRNPVIVTDVNHKRRTIPAPHKVIRNMTYTVRPMKPKGLRHNANHIRIGIQRHQLVTFKPRLMTHMHTSPRKPPQTRKIALTTIGRKIPNRHTIKLKRKRRAPRQRKAQTALTRVELQVNDTRTNRPSRHHRRQHT